MGIKRARKQKQKKETQVVIAIFLKNKNLFNKENFVYIYNIYMFQMAVISIVLYSFSSLGKAWSMVGVRSNYQLLFLHLSMGDNSWSSKGEVLEMDGNITFRCFLYILVVVDVWYWFCFWVIIPSIWPVGTCSYGATS